MLWDANLFCEMAEQDVFLSLNARLEAQASTVNMEDYIIPTGAECMVMHHDQQVAMPWMNPAPLLYYNVDMFDAAGIERPSDDWTWDDFLAITQELTQDTDGDGEVDQWGYMQGNSWDEDFVQWIWSNGGLAINDDFTHTTLDSPETLDALRFVHDLRFVHNVWPKAEEAEAMAAVGIGNPFVGGKVGILYTNTGGIGNFNRTITDFTYDILHFPKSPTTGQRSLWTFMQNFAAPSWSEHPDLDADLVILLGGPSSQAWAARTKLQVPTYRPVVENEYNTQPPENIRVVPEMYAGEDVRHQPIFKGRSEWVQTVFGSEITKAFIGEVDLDSAIASAIAEGDRILARAAS
jgi:multiple sugar transport system substrate-binding protein